MITFITCGLHQLIPFEMFGWRVIESNFDESFITFFFIFDDIEHMLTLKIHM